MWEEVRALKTADPVMVCLARLALLAELLFQSIPYRDLRYESVVGQAEWYTCGLPQRRTDVLLRRLDRGGSAL